MLLVSLIIIIQSFDQYIINPSITPVETNFSKHFMHIPISYSKVELNNTPVSHTITHISSAMPLNIESKMANKYTIAKKQDEYPNYITPTYLDSNFQDLMKSFEDKIEKINPSIALEKKLSEKMIKNARDLDKNETKNLLKGNKSVSIVSIKSSENSKDKNIIKKETSTKINVYNEINKNDESKIQDKKEEEYDNSSSPKLVSNSGEKKKPTEIKKEDDKFSLDTIKDDKKSYIKKDQIKPSKSPEENKTPTNNLRDEKAPRVITESEFNDFKNVFMKSFMDQMNILNKKIDNVAKIQTKQATQFKKQLSVTTDSVSNFLTKYKQDSQKKFEIELAKHEEMKLKSSKKRTTKYITKHDSGITNKMKSAQKIKESVKPESNDKVKESVKPESNDKVKESVKPESNDKVKESVKPDSNDKVKESVKPDSNEKSKSPSLTNSFDKYSINSMYHYLFDEARFKSLSSTSKLKSSSSKTSTSAQLHNHNQFLKLSLHNKHRLKLNSKAMAEIFYRNHPTFEQDQQEISDIINYSEDELNQLKNSNVSVDEVINTANAVGAQDVSKVSNEPYVNWSSDNHRYKQMSKYNRRNNYSDSIDIDNRFRFKSGHPVLEEGLVWISDNMDDVNESLMNGYAVAVPKSMQGAIMKHLAEIKDGKYIKVYDFRA